MSTQETQMEADAEFIFELEFLVPTSPGIGLTIIADYVWTSESAQFECFLVI